MTDSKKQLSLKETSSIIIHRDISINKNKDNGCFATKHVEAGAG